MFVFIVPEKQNTVYNEIQEDSEYTHVSPKSFCDFKDKLLKIAGVSPAVHTI